MGILNKLKKVHKNVFFVGLISFFMQLGASIIYCTANILVEGKLLSENQLNLLRQISESISILIKVPSGYISDLMNDRKTFLMIGNGSMIFWKLLFFMTTFRDVFSMGFLTIIFIVTQSGDRITNSLRDVLRDALLMDSSVNNKKEEENQEMKSISFSVRKTIASFGSIIGSLIGYFVCIKLISYVFSSPAEIDMAKELPSKYSQFISKILYGFAIIPVTIAVYILNKSVQDINVTKKITNKNQISFKKKVSIFFKEIIGMNEVIVLEGETKEEERSTIRNIANNAISFRQFLLDLLFISISIILEYRILCKNSFINFENSFLKISNKFFFLFLSSIYIIFYFRDKYQRSYEKSSKKYINFEFSVAFLIIPKIIMLLLHFLQSKINGNLLPFFSKLCEIIYIGFIILSLFKMITEIFTLEKRFVNHDKTKRIILQLLTHGVLFGVVYFLVYFLPNVSENLSLGTFSLKSLKFTFVLLPFIYSVFYFVNYIKNTTPYQKLSLYREKFKKLKILLLFVSFFYLGRVNDTIFFTAGKSLYGQLGHSQLMQKAKVPLMFCLTYIAIVLFTPVYSYLMQKKRTKISSAIMITFLIGSNLLLVFGKSIAMIYASFLFLGIAQAGTDSVIAVLTTNVIPESENKEENLRGTVFGFLHAFVGLSSLINAIVFMLLKNSYGIKTALLFMNFPSALAFITSIFI